MACARFTDVTWPDPTESYVRLKGAFPVTEAFVMMLRQTDAAAVDPLPWIKEISLMLDPPAVHRKRSIQYALAVAPRALVLPK